ncbi:Ribose-phosphate pyrophosphokinase [Blastopirellula retiformator]|uniref:Ribose-phosphate pyrophosphokinase n=2 Tax=Blastopirellula retiformator TaxID=2527970 RepID=A0A5C5UUV0_9BACT|nr:Ribose-phosphate pyrophosphokinase [Blastopirellula retiformator]
MRSGQSGKAKYAYFKNLDYGEVSEIERFIQTYQQRVIIDLNSNIEKYFGEELDSCMALDYGHSTPGTRTETGQLEYEAKYQGNDEASESLAKMLARAAFEIPFRAHSTVTRCITYIPPTEDKDFHLPRDLAHEMRSQISNPFFKEDVVDATLTIDKESLKNASLEAKVEIWQEIVEADAVELKQDVNGKLVYVVDDLYQSGVTMWSYAKYLKKQGAHAVFGLPCVKSLRDSDNQ